MKNILIFLFICFGFALNSQITITCYECKKNTTVDCKGCNIQSNLFTGIVIKEKGKPDIPLYEPYKVSNKSSVFTFEDAFGTKTIVNVTSVLSYNTPKKLYDYLSNCLCKPSTIDTDTDRYSVLIQDSILVTYDINGVEIDRDTIRLFDIDTDTKTFLVQDSILVYYDIQNNEIGRDTIKIPFVDTDIQTYLTQDSILVYYDESNTEIGRDTIRIPSIASITEQGDFRISNDTLYHNNSIDGIEQFVKLPSIDTTTQSYLPILNGLDTIGYENITYLGGVEVDRDTITLPLHKNQVQSNETQAVPYTGVELPTTPGINIGDTNSTQFSDGTVVNYTWDGVNWIPKFLESWGEKRICLNTATPPFTPADPNNPTITEVEAWKNANLSLLDQQNGTILTYFVDGDGGSCDVPDYTWTLNKGSELITLDNKRVFNTKTVYVDAGSGSDITGRRGYREYPFKTLNAAIAVLQDYDLLYVFPGDYTSSINTNKIINIYCEDGVNWLYTSTLTSAQVLTQPTEVSWRFDKLYTNNPNIGLTGPGLTAHNYGVHLKINKAENVNYFGATGSAPNFRSTSLDVIESYNSGLTPITLNNVYPNPEISIKIHNVYKTTPAVAVGRGNSENTISNINFDNVYWETNGASNSSNFAGIFYGTDVNTHNKITTFKFNSVKSVRTPSLAINPIFMSYLDAQIIGPGNLASSFFRSYGMSNGDRVTVDVLDGVFETHTIGHSFYPVSRSDYSYRFTIKGRQKNGLAFYTTQNAFSNNNEIYVNLDVVTNEHAAVYIGLDNTTLNPLSTIYISGRIKTTRASFPCIILGNNQNNRIVLKDLTLINDGTVSPIMINSANPENITIQNVTSNSLISDPNILEIGQSIIRNTNYK